MWRVTNNWGKCIINTILSNIIFQNQKENVLLGKTIILVTDIRQFNFTMKQ